MIAALLLAGLTALSQLPQTAAPRAALRDGLAPLEAVLSRSGSGLTAIASVLEDTARTRADNDRLRSENADLRRQVAQLSAAGQENDSLRQALAFERASGHRTLGANVIARGPDPISRSLTIDRGRADGVQEGMVVVAGGGLVGRVRDVAAHSATVQTVADPASRVNAYTVKSNLEGTVVGGQGLLRMEVLARPPSAAAPGEWVLTSGIGAGYPRGLVVGQVVRFQRRDSATTELADVALAAQLATVTALMVITDFQPR
jgi:rod shape-determining protein MreC